MDQYTENRFSDYRDLDKAGLEKEKENLKKELSEYYEELENPSMNGNQRSEMLNSDIPFARDRLEYVEYLLSKYPDVPKL